MFDGNIYEFFFSVKRNLTKLYVRTFSQMFFWGKKMKINMNSGEMKFLYELVFTLVAKTGKAWTKLHTRDEFSKRKVGKYDDDDDYMVS